MYLYSLGKYRWNSRRVEDSGVVIILGAQARVGVGNVRTENTECTKETNAKGWSESEIGFKFSLLMKKNFLFYQIT